MKNLKIVILDNPLTAWKDKRAEQLFLDIVELRLLGYQELYSEHVLPLNDSDFVAIHKVICSEENGRLIPLLGNATLTTDRAKFYHLPFSGMSLAEATGSKSHVKEMQKIVDRCDREGKRLGYDGGYVISPHVRGDRELATKLHEMFQLMKVHFLKQYRIDESITAATCRFKVERICKFWGYQALEQDGARLGDVPVPRYDNELVTIMHMKDLDPKAIEAAKTFKLMWDNRIVISGSEIAQRRKKAA